MKFIKSYEEWNGANLALNYNTTCDFRTFQGRQFDGGDGPSATEVPMPQKQVKDEPVIDKGANPKKKQEERRKRDKKLSKEYRIAKLMKYQTDDDLIKFAPRMEPTINAT